VALVTIALLAFVLRAINAWRRPFHTDERISLLWGALPVKDMLHMVRTFDVHPPLLFLALHALGLIHAPDWVARMIAVVLGTASVLMLYAVVRIWADEWAALGAGACAAVMPVLVFYDTWVRMYVLSDALVMAQFLILSLILKRADSTKARWWLWAAWAVATVLAGYTLYLSWFATLAQLLYVLALRRDQIVAAGAALACAVVAWFPQVPALLHQLGMGGQTFQAFHGHELGSFLLLSGQATIAPELEGWFAALAAAFAWIWILAAFWAAISYSRTSLLLWLGMPALLTMIYGVFTHKLIYLDRYYIFFAYALSAWTGCLIMLAVQRRWRGALVGTIAALAGVAILGIAYSTDSMFYTADWPGVAKALASELQPGDLIIMEQGMPQWSMAGDKDIATHRHLYLFWANQIPGTLSTAQKFKRVWVMAYEPRGIDPNLSLLNELGRHYRLAAAYPFNRFLPAEDVVLLLFTR
jgi:hypothetical protein